MPVENELMDDKERLRIFQYADDHEYDEDENADFVIETEDPVLAAMAALANHYGMYSEIMVTGEDLLDAVNIVATTLGSLIDNSQKG